MRAFRCQAAGPKVKVKRQRAKRKGQRAKGKEESVSWWQQSQTQAVGDDQRTCFHTCAEETPANLSSARRNLEPVALVLAGSKLPVSIGTEQGR